MFILNSREHYSKNTLFSFNFILIFDLYLFLIITLIFSKSLILIIYFKSFWIFRYILKVLFSNNSFIVINSSIKTYKYNAFNFKLSMFRYNLILYNNIMFK